MIPAEFKIGAGIVIFVGAVALGLQVADWRHDALALPAAVAAKDQAIRDRNQIRRDTATETARVAGINQGLHDELETLRGAARAPAPVVRLCHAPAAPAGHTASDAAAAGRIPGTAAGAGELRGAPAGVARPDIGPDLIALMREADHVVAACRAGQAWAKGVPTVIDTLSELP